MALTEEALTRIAAGERTGLAEERSATSKRIDAARRDGQLLQRAIAIAEMLKGLTCPELKVVEGKVRMMLGVKDEAGAQ